MLRLVEALLTHLESFQNAQLFPIVIPVLTTALKSPRTYKQHNKNNPIIIQFIQATAKRT